MARILESIVEQHAENAAFLWLLRDRAVDAPHYRPHHLARLDQRVEANLDGLRIAGEAGWRIVMDELARHGEAGELFAAAVLALESGDAARVDLLVEIAERTPEVRRGFLSALGWVRPDLLKPTIRRWLGEQEPFGRYLGVVACSQHRVDPGAHIVAWLRDPYALLRRRALRLVGEIGRSDLASTIADTLTTEPDGTCSSWAAWSLGLLHQPAVLPLLMVDVENGASTAAGALEVAVRLGEGNAVRNWIRHLARDPSTRRPAVEAAGRFGDPAAVPWLISLMLEPAMMRLAGESWSLITGIDPVEIGATLPAIGEVTVDTLDATEEVAGLDPDDGLPWLDQQQLQACWEASRARFPTGCRLLLGQPVAAAAWDAAWRNGTQRVRRTAAYEAAMTSPAAVLRNWRRRGDIRHPA